MQILGHTAYSLNLVRNFASSINHLQLSIRTGVTRVTSCGKAMKLRDFLLKSSG
jgi:hypothetical protein